MGHDKKREGMVLRDGRKVLPQVAPERNFIDSQVIGLYGHLPRVLFNLLVSSINRKMGSRVE